MTFTEFWTHKKWVDVQTALELAYHKDQEAEMKAKKR